MFGGLLGWYTIYTFLGFCPSKRILPGALCFAHVIFWATICKTVRPMLSDHCLSVSLSRNVGVLWSNSWMDRDATWYANRPQPRPHCVRWGPSSPSQPPPLFSPCLSGPNGWMDQDATWYWGRPQPNMSLTLNCKLVEVFAARCLHCLRLCFFIHFVCKSNISGTAKRISAKFTGKTCLVPSLNVEYVFGPEYKYNGKRAKVKVTRDKKLHFSANFYGLSTIMGIAERICAKFKWKTHLVHWSDEFDYQSKRWRSPEGSSSPLAMHCKASPGSPTPYAANDVNKQQTRPFRHSWGWRINRWIDFCCPLYFSIKSRIFSHHHWISLLWRPFAMADWYRQYTQ